MQRKRGLVPIGDAVYGLDDVPAIRNDSPQARHHFTVADQVDQLVSASEADPDLGFMARVTGIMLPAPYQPRQPAPIRSSQRPLQIRDDRWDRQ